MSNGDRRELSIEQQRYRFFRRVAYDTVIASLLISCGAEATQILLSNTATPSPTSPTPDTPKPAEIPATQFTREGDAIVVDVQDIATYEGLEAYLIKIGIYLTTPKEGWTQQALPSAVGVERHVLIASDENGTHQSDFLVVTTYDSVNKKARISFGKPEDQQAWTSATLDQNAPMLVGYSPEAKTALLKLLFKDGNFLTIGRALQTVFPDGQGSLSPLSGQDLGHANIGAVFSPVLGTPEPGPDGSVTIRIGPQYVVLFADLDAPTGPKFVEVSFSPPSQEDAYQASLNQASTELGEAIVRIETDDSGMARAYLTETPQPGELPFGVFVEGKWMWYKQYKLNQQAGDLGLQPGQYVFHLGDGASMSERLDTAVVMDNKGEVIADIKWDEVRGEWKTLIAEWLQALHFEDLSNPEVIQKIIDLGNAGNNAGYDTLNRLLAEAASRAENPISVISKLELLRSDFTSTGSKHTFIRGVTPFAFERIKISEKDYYIVMTVRNKVNTNEFKDISMVIGGNVGGIEIQELRYFPNTNQAPVSKSTAENIAFVLQATLNNITIEANIYQIFGSSSRERIIERYPNLKPIIDLYDENIDWELESRNVVKPAGPSVKYVPILGWIIGN